MNITKLEDKLFVASDTLGVSAYDFGFELHFDCSHPYQIEEEALCVLRIGAIANYAVAYEENLAMGLRLVNSPTEHARASELENWYPLIQALTPRTLVFDSLPTADEIEANFTWPIFLKGSRQTSKHSDALSVIRSRHHYEEAAHHYRADSILHWQKPVIREFVPLKPVAGKLPGTIQPSVEYRSFWWHGTCVGWGRYWYQAPAYECADVECGLALAKQAAQQLQVPFLVIDFAKTQDDRWIVIECNDAQESGYAATPPHRLWRNVLDQITP